MARLDVSSFDATFAASNDPITIPYTVPAGSNNCLQVLVFWLSGSGHAIPDSNVTYNSVALTSVAAEVSQTNTKAHLWRMVNAPAGEHDLVVDPTSGVGDAAVLILVRVDSDVDQTTPIDGYVSGSGTTQSGSVTGGEITSESGDTACFFIGWRGTGMSEITPTGYDERVQDTSGTLIASYGDAAGAATVTVSGAVDSPTINAFIAVGYNLNQTGGGEPSGAIGSYYSNYYKNIVLGLSA